jgi:hypothetical protein
VKQLSDETAFPDPGNPDNRSHLDRLVSLRAVECLEQRRELISTADQRGRVVATARLAEARARANCLPTRNGSGLPLGVGRRQRLVFDRIARRPIRSFADNDTVDRRGGLQASRGVDDVARRDGLPERRICVESDERFTRVDADPDMEIEVRIPFVRARQRLSNRERCANGALRIVFVRGRCAEDRHHGIAGELLDRAVALLELLAHERVVGSQHRSHIFNVHPLGPARKADEIREQDRNDLPFLETTSAFHEPGATACAEVSIHRVRMVAVAANPHRSTLIHRMRRLDAPAVRSSDH